MTTRILHVSDTHLGFLQYRSDVRRDDFADAFEAAVNIAIEEEVDAVLHTGDLFNDPAPNLPTINRCWDILTKLDDADIPFYAIVGNHERKLEEQWMDLFERVDCAERLDKAPTVINDEAALYGIDAVRSPNWESADFTLTPTDDHHYTFVCMHELFKPLVPEYRGDPYSLAQTIQRFNFKPDAMPLGDYHAQDDQSVAGVRAFYPGSTERCKVNESGDRAVYMLEVEDGDLTISSRTIASAPESDAPREFVVVECTLGDGDSISTVANRLDEELAGRPIDDKVVVVTLKGESAPVTTAEVYQLLDDRGAAVTNVDDKRSVAGEVDVDIENHDVQDIKSMVDNAVTDLELSDTVTEVEQFVRDEDIKQTNIRDKVSESVDNHLEAAFDTDGDSQ